jgi:hypothetical protein
MEVKYDQIKLATNYNAVCPITVAGITVTYSCSPLNALMELPALFELRNDVECIIINDECYYKNVPKDLEDVNKAIRHVLSQEEDPTKGDTSFQLIHDTGSKLLEVVIH